MRKWIHLLPVVLLICGLGVCLYIYRFIPIKSMILPDNAEQSVVAVVIRRMDERDSKTKEIQDENTISAVIASFQNIGVQYQSLTDTIPVAPVLYSIVFISSEQGVCPEVDITSNGSVYTDGVRYRIASGNKAELVSYLENLFSKQKLSGVLYLFYDKTGCILVVNNIHSSEKPVKAQNVLFLKGK